MLVKITRLNDPIIVTKHWPHGDLPTESIVVLWSAIGTVGKNVAEQIIRDLYDKPQYVEIPRKNFASDKFVEFGKHFDFSIEDFDDDRAESTEPLKLYTVTVPIKFTGRRPINKYTSLVLASDEKIAEERVINNLALDSSDYDGPVQVLEIGKPFYNGQILTLNSQK